MIIIIVSAVKYLDHFIGLLAFTSFESVRSSQKIKAQDFQLLIMNAYNEF